MSELKNNAIAFLQNRFPVALVLNNELTARNEHGVEIFTSYPMIASDSQSGVKQRAIAIKDLGANGELPYIASNLTQIFTDLDAGMYVKIGNALKPRGHDIDTNQMTIAPRVIIYTNKLFVSIENVINEFSKVKILIDVVDESEMHKTLFISYGGPDEEAATAINEKISSKGVKTWFFPIDAAPGEKLHRMMYEGVNKHDHVLLLCSEASLKRPGVLNEIERVLEREAKEGGSDIIIPVTLDDFVHGNWASHRADIAEQIRSRVITKIDLNDKRKFDDQINKIVEVLRR